MSLINKENKKLYNKLINEMLQDYSSEDFTYQMLADKYNVCMTTIQNIVKKHKFKEKKAKFQEDVLNKSIDKLSTRHARVLSRLTTIMEEQVERLQLAQRRDKTKILEPARMKEVLMAFALLSKEHRLNTDQPTDNNNITIKVDFGDSIPVISENHIINSKPDVEVDSAPVEDKPMIESPAVEEAVEVIVDNQDEDDFILGSIE